MSRSITTLRNAKPAAKPYKLADEKGLCLLVQPSGGMLWRFKFRTDGRDEAGNPKRVERKLGFGTYPDVGVRTARDLRDDARAMLAKGSDPADQKRRAKQVAKVSAANTFAAVAESYIAKNERDGLAENTVKKRLWLLSILRKAIGQPIAEIEPFAILDAVRPFEAAKNEEKAQRALHFVGQVYRFAIANQLATSDPTRDLGSALANPCSFRRCCSFDPVSCARPNGLKSIWMQPYGAFVPRG